MEVLIALLESKKPVDINILSKDEKITPLCTAINLNFLELLIKHHADINTLSHHGTPLHVAI